MTVSGGNHRAESNRETMMRSVIDLLSDARRVVVTGHEFVDGDATGSEIALSRGLEALGKRVEVINNESLMRRYAFLDPEGRCRVYDPDRDREIIRGADVAIVVDNNTWQRLRRLERPFRETEATVVCIDHHLPGEPFSGHHLYDTGAAATGELVWDILCAMNAPIDRGCAEAIYTAICSDTGWFRHSNTTQRTFEIARELVAHGVDPARVNLEVNHQDLPATKRLLARVLDAMTFECGGRLCWASMPLAMREDADVPLIETEDFIDHLRSVRGVMMAVLMKEMKDGGVKVSIRSRGGYSAHAVAAPLGGGGHFHASGITLPGPFDEAVRRVREKARAQFVD